MGKKYHNFSVTVILNDNPDEIKNFIVRGYNRNHVIELLNDAIIKKYYPTAIFFKEIKKIKPYFDI